MHFLFQIVPLHVSPPALVPYSRDPAAGCKMDWGEGDVWSAGLLFNAFSILGAMDDDCEAAWVDFKVVRVNEATGNQTWMEVGAGRGEVEGEGRVVIIFAGRLVRHRRNLETFSFFI